jgi:hypothetical protein
MLTLQTCAALTGESVNGLVLRAEEGALRLVFNIAVPGCQARALRVMTNSLADYLKQGRRLNTDSPAQVRAEIAALFSVVSIDVSTEKLMHTLSCSKVHLAHLREAKCLKVLRAGRFGPGGQTRYCRESVINWLMERRLS